MDLVQSGRTQPETENSLFLESGKATLPKECGVNIETVYTVPYWSLRYWGSADSLITSPTLQRVSYDKMMDCIDKLERKRWNMKNCPSWRAGATEELSHTPSNAPIPSNTSFITSPTLQRVSYDKMMNCIDQLERKRWNMKNCPSWRAGATEELSHTPSNAPIPSNTTTPSSPSTPSNAPIPSNTTTPSSPSAPSNTPTISCWTHKDIELSIARVWEWDKYRSEQLLQERRWQDGNHRFGALSEDLSESSMSDRGGWRRNRLGPGPFI
ncbi:hypothetical protein QBC45DRAFT_158370 [Copromyces sp. CBS 386.78]|nr:hypothetical protein QBC45DRAFT_158370 [Copromyces sp. CBS 386.78]